jgi:ATP-dependent helicase/DNAse subunit B
VEEKFEFALNPTLTIRGRIDRIDLDSSDRALVIDYKYSAANQIKNKMNESAEGSNVQGGLYLLAAERALRLKTRGMFFCGLKKGVTWEGWDQPADLTDLKRTAEVKALEVHEAALGGHLPVVPTDKDKCRWCDYRDICRVESTAQPQTVEAGQ